MPMKNLLVFLAALLAVFPQATVARTQAPANECVLGNGMRIIVKEDHRAPTAVHMVWYKAGSMDEQNGTTGVAHVLEHMMFKGTKKLKAGEFSSRVAALGGRDNAFTSKDFTAYFQQIGKEHLDKVMALEADRMANAVFSKEEFAKEIQVVMEERRLRTDDQPLALVHEALYATAFFSHPYHHPIIGWMSDLASMTVEDARAWYRQWYVPNNASMVVVGDVAAKEVCRMAERYFGAIPSRPLQATRPQGEAPQRGTRRVAVKAPAENPYIALAFKVPPLRNVEQDIDPYALEVLAAVLDGYDNARLNARLVRTARVANSVSADYGKISRGPALFVLDGVPASGTSPETLEKLLLDEIARIANEGVSPDELQRVKTQLASRQIFKRDSAFGQAMEIGEMEMSGISYRYLDRIIEKLESVTSEEVQSVARKYFNIEDMTTATLVPLPLSEKKPAPAPSPALKH